MRFYGSHFRLIETLEGILSLPWYAHLVVIPIISAIAAALILFEGYTCAEAPPLTAVLSKNIKVTILGFIAYLFFLLCSWGYVALAHSLQVQV